MISKVRLMHKIFAKYFIFPIVYLSFLSITVVYAAPFPSIFEGDLIDLFLKLIALIRPIVTIVFLGVFMYGGYIRMVSGDNQDQIKKSYAILTSAVFGISIIWLAPQFVNLIASIFGIQLLIGT